MSNVRSSLSSTLDTFVLFFTCSLCVTMVLLQMISPILLLLGEFPYLRFQSLNFRKLFNLYTADASYTGSSSILQRFSQTQCFVSCSNVSPCVGPSTSTGILRHSSFLSPAQYQCFVSCSSGCVSPCLVPSTSILQHFPTLTQSQFFVSCSRFSTCVVPSMSILRCFSGFAHAYSHGLWVLTVSTSFFSQSVMALNCFRIFLVPYRLHFRAILKVASWSLAPL
jgi:hypothetical protein